MSARILGFLRAHPLPSFFLLTAAFSWICLVLAYLVFDNSLFLAWIGVFGPALSGLVLSGVCDGKPGLERLIAGLFRWKVGWGWYLVVLGVPNLLVMGTIALHDGPAEAAAWLAALPRQFPLVLGLALLLAPVIMGEEIGWRGFALPRLQERHGQRRASLLLGFLWGIWHIPAALDVNNVLNRAPLFQTSVLFILGTIGFSFLFTWIWNGTGGSLLLMCLFHSYYNTINQVSSSAYPYLIDQFWYYLAVLAGVVLAVQVAHHWHFSAKHAQPEARPG